MAINNAMNLFMRECNAIDAKLIDCAGFLTFEFRFQNINVDQRLSN